MSYHKIDLIGMTVGEKGQVLKCLGQDKHHHYKWLVRCGCGKEFKSVGVKDRCVECELKHRTGEE